MSGMIYITPSISSLSLPTIHHLEFRAGMVFAITLICHLAFDFQRAVLKPTTLVRNMLPIARECDVISDLAGNNVVESTDDCLPRYYFDPYKVGLPNYV